MNSNIRNAKVRRAPNGKVYAVWFGRAICDANGGLRYFDDEREAREFLEQCDVAVLLATSAA